MADAADTETVTMEDIVEDDDDEMEINNNNNNNDACAPSNNNNNSGMKNNNYASSSVIGESSSSSRSRPVNIQVTAKVLFGSVSAISALNAERKKKPGGAPPQ